MPRKIAITLYGFGVLTAGWLMVVFLSANTHLLWEWRADYAAASFIPMVLLMLGVLYSQIRAQTMLWLLIPIVLIASGSLLYSMLLYAFPEKSKLIGLVHLGIVIVALSWIFVRTKLFGVRR